MTILKAALLYTPDLTLYLPKLARTASTFSKATAARALELLNDKLKVRGKSVTMILIGGGAMLLVYGGRTLTQDLDVIPHPDSAAQKDLIEACRDEVTADLAKTGVNLPPDWINCQASAIFHDQAKYFQPGDLRPVATLDFSHLHIFVASPEALLAMKIQSMRAGTKDLRDVENLVRILKLRSYEQLIEVVSARVEDINIIGNDEQKILKGVFQRLP